jgi:inosine-uridine nucleoside N-ribohydrolase
MRWFGSIAVLALVVASCSTTADEVGIEPTTSSSPLVTGPPAPPRAVILDYSPTVSDVGALAFLATHPSVFLIGVTLAGTGETDCEPGVAMTLGILEFLDRADVPVACGQPDPIDGNNAFPADWRLSASDLGIDLVEPSGEMSASELMVDLVRASPIPVDFVATAPLTNLAVAFAVDPELASLVGSITVMGGAIDVAGSATDLAEWNMWVDPVAASDVLRSGVPVTLVPLDATNLVPTGPTFFDALDSQAVTPAAQLLRNMWVADGPLIENVGRTFFFWDELAAVVLIDQSLATFETLRLVVELDDPETEGWTRVDPDGAPVRIATAVHRLAFEQLLLETLVGGSAELDYSVDGPE